jgi:nucleoside-diphosphate-sugar epimerase
MKKTALVLGGGGFIGGHLAKRLKQEGYYVRIVDIKNHEYFDHAEICHESYRRRNGWAAGFRR